MNPNEMNEMMEWLTDNFSKLSMPEMALCVSAISEFTEKIKPIYIKHKLNDDKSTFLFKM